MKYSSLITEYTISKVLSEVEACKDGDINLANSTFGLHSNFAQQIVDAIDWAGLKDLKLNMCGAFYKLADSPELWSSFCKKLEMANALKSLDLEQCQLKKISLPNLVMLFEALQHKPYLQKLSLKHNYFSDLTRDDFTAIAEEIVKLPSAIKIDLGDNDLTPHYISQTNLSILPNITGLDTPRFVSGQLAFGQVGLWGAHANFSSDAEQLSNPPTHETSVDHPSFKSPPPL
ncbi:MAG: hypothetical protein HKM04_06065 [Legionellales bacterium]|nr:hypothetical protein [Legionellales bacterium]